MGTTHSAWLLKVIMGLHIGRTRSESDKNNAGRELGDLSNIAAEDSLGGGQDRGAEAEYI